ncbi:hypothetical protein [Paenibacillus sp. GCM10027626]|uniref:hypothetical protein n=1 Tax=Paenibacillus sp. GCM10027626 TaxID=3273411 RepID=UPI0036295546
MMNYDKRFLSISLIVLLSFVLISCNKSIAPPNAAKPAKDVAEKILVPFHVNEEDIASVTIYREPEKGIPSGLIETAEDVATIADILNNSEPPPENGTADYYCQLDLNLKDSSKISLEFGGRGGFFKIVDTGVFYGLKAGYREKLNDLVDRIEKGNANIRK